ncbi:hypothetical protein FRB94_008317 [Tulasnella sp. JGI-2019a]|nr:hypothetical protein FRB94_008317 [Tulasnella sp. JGI-2019a]KAG9033698.1 hypothetical protein FRB95_014487 [Tulasnella sp. JGI-2019a]
MHFTLGQACLALNLLWIQSVHGLPHEPRQSSSTNSTSSTPSTVSVTISTGANVTGIYDTSIGLNSYLGIPFAQPPVGNLRFSPPVPVAPGPSGQQILATSYPPACLQDTQNSLVGSYGISEDCLYLNVWSTHNVTQTSKLPVMIWVYGGAFVEGAASTYNPTSILLQASVMQSPIIFVGLQYRLGIWGFCQGVQCGANNATNLGLRDQVMAFQWVQDNIEAFGGDPNKVVIAGESAGAGSIALHYLNPAIQKKPLFRGAIMESGTADVVGVGKPNQALHQSAFDAIANLTGCSPNATATANSSAQSTSGTTAYNQAVFDCLKSANNETLFNATVTIERLPQYDGLPIFGPTLDGDIVPDYPSKLIASGKFAKVPFISGNNLDEGTLFVPPTINSTAEYDELGDQVFRANQTVLTKLQSFYPTLAEGSPFGSGNETFGLSPIFKQAAAIFGDVAFHAPRRFFLKHAQAFGLQNTYSYLFTQNTDTNTTAYTGVSHGSEVTFVFGAYTAAAAQIMNTTFPAPVEELSSQMVAYWVNYVNFLNPNGNISSPISQAVAKQLNLTSWPLYGGGSGNMLQLQGGNLTVVQDDYRSAPISYMNSLGPAILQ